MQPGVALFFVGIVAVAVAQPDGDSSVENLGQSNVQMQQYTYTLQNVDRRDFPSVEIRTVSISESPCTPVHMYTCNRPREPCWVYDSTNHNFTVASSNVSDFDYENFEINGESENTKGLLRTVTCTAEPYQAQPIANRTQTNNGTTHDDEPPTSDFWYHILSSIVMAFLLVLVIFCGISQSNCVRPWLCEQFKKLEPCIEVVKKYFGRKNPNGQLRSSVSEPNVQLQNSVSETDMSAVNTTLPRTSPPTAKARGPSPNGGRDEYADQALVELHGNRSGSGNPRSSPELVMAPLPPVDEETHNQSLNSEPTQICADATSTLGTSSHTYGNN